MRPPGVGRYVHIPVECFGKEASAWASRMLTGKQVRLSYDRSQGRTDRYDRTLAYVWLPDGRSFQWAMLNDDGIAGE